MFCAFADQAERLELLRLIDHYVTDIHHSAARDWLLQPDSSTLFGRYSPVAFMAREGREGIEAVLSHLKMMAFGGSASEPHGRREPLAASQAGASSQAEARSWRRRASCRSAASSRLWAQVKSSSVPDAKEFRAP